MLVHFVFKAVDARVWPRGSQELLAAALTAHANASCKALKRLVMPQSCTTGALIEANTTFGAPYYN